MLHDFGLADGAYRLDPTVHPFATSFSLGHRMTTRCKPTNLRALWAGMHEAGYGLTYQGTEPELARSPLYGNASLGESQSRTWENLVGRSLAFWRGRLTQRSAASRSSSRSTSTPGTAGSTASRRA